MSAIIGALRAELSASIAQFQSDMGKAADSLSGFSKKARSISKDLEDVGKKMSLAITAPLGLLAKAGYDQARQASQAIAQVEAALESTQGVSGKTAAGLEATADALAHISVFEKNDILKNVTAQLLGFSNIQGPIFDKAQKAVLDLASRMGGDLEGAAVKVGRALNDPIQGVQALTRVGVQFTTNEKEQIKYLVQHQQGLQAQQMILDKLTQKYGGAAQALRDATPDAKIQQAWHDFEEAIGDVLVKFIVPMTDDLVALLKIFQQLPEPIQEFAVGFGAILAIAGPLMLIFSPMVRVIGILTPLVYGLGVAIAGLGAEILLPIAAIAALGVAIVLFSKTIGDLLNGDLAKAWEDAKKTASDAADSIVNTYKKLTTAPKPTVPSAAAGVGGGQGKGGQNFDLHNEDDIKKAEAATKALQAQLDQASIRLQHGFDSINLPKATADANAFNAQLDEYVKRAKDAGANTGQFADQIAALRKRAADLQQAGLAKEAKEFSAAVDDDALAVDRFAKGGLPPLQEKLAAVDDQYKQLHDKITTQIEENQALADSNDDARKAMEKLQSELAALETAHQKATKAAEDQQAAEEGIAHLESFSRQLDVSNKIVDFQQTKNGAAPVGQNAQDLQNAQRMLDQELASAETQYQKTINERREGEGKLSQQQLDDLDAEAKKYQEYADLVASTTAEQIVQGERANKAWSNFSDNLADSLSNMIENWTFDLKGLYNVFADLAKELFMKPALSGLGDAIKGGIADLFSGGHASGGYIPPGHWGIVGEKGPEPAFGGDTGLTVQSNASMGGRGVTQVFNISTPDANSFRRGQRQVQREARSKLGMG